jgi:hypothetical protein
LPLVVALFFGALGALSIGLASAWIAVRSPAPIDAIAIGAWQAWPNAGTVDVDPYSRARLARTGEIPLGSGEGLTLIASTADDERPLTSACDYAVAGQTPPARLWTLGVESIDGDPLFEMGAPAAISSEALLRGLDGAFEIVFSASPHSGNWIAVPGDGRRFRIVMRLYDTTARTTTALTTLAMPSIRRVRCGR